MDPNQSYGAYPNQGNPYWTTNGIPNAPYGHQISHGILEANSYPTSNSFEYPTIYVPPASQGVPTSNGFSYPLYHAPHGSATSNGPGYPMWPQNGQSQSSNLDDERDVNGNNSKPNNLNGRAGSLRCTRCRGDKHKVQLNFFSHADY
jgi:hypothetical protein